MINGKDTCEYRINIFPTGVAKASENAMSVDKLPEEINEMKIRDDKVKYLV